MKKENISISLLLVFIVLLIANIVVLSYKIRKDFEYQKEATKKRKEAIDEAKKERATIIQQDIELIELEKSRK